MTTRQVWGQPLGIPEGTDFTLEAILTIAGQVDTARVSASATITLTVSDSVLNGGTALLSDEASDSFTKAAGLVKWNITDTQSSGWEPGTYDGDIKSVDSNGAITMWPVGLQTREARD